METNTQGVWQVNQVRKGCYENTGFRKTNSVLCLWGDVNKINRNGWILKSNDVHNDYYTWSVKFEAAHEDHGKVWGDFNDIVYCSKVNGLRKFLESFDIIDFDYADI